MKFILIVILSSYSVLLKSQSYIDTLKKYSYHVFGFSLNPVQDSAGMAKINFASGSGFFIRKKKSLFFITSKHVLTGCDSGKPRNHPTDFLIWISPDSSYKVISLNVSIVKDTSSCLPISLSPDMIAIKINDTSVKEVLSVEKFIHPRFKKVKNSLIIGYPGIENIMGFKAPAIIDFKSGTYQIESAFTDSTLKTIDIINYYIYSREMVIDKTLNGVSGSPFFVQDLKTEKWRIAGIVTSTGHRANKINEKYISTVIIDYAIAEIDNILNRK